MVKKEITPFDKRRVYKTKIAPIVDALRRACTENGVPMFFTAAVENKEDGTTAYETEMISAGTHEMELGDDRIAKMVNVINGFRVVFPVTPEALDDYL